MSADVTPAPATGPPAAPGTGTSEVEAPVSADVAPDPATTVPVTTPAATARTERLGRRAVPGYVPRCAARSTRSTCSTTPGRPVLQRLVPVLGGGLLLVLIVLLIRRLRAG